MGSSGFHIQLLLYRVAERINGLSEVYNHFCREEWGTQGIANDVKLFERRS